MYVGAYAIAKIPQRLPAFYDPDGYITNKDYRLLVILSLAARVCYHGVKQPRGNASCKAW